MKKTIDNKVEKPIFVLGCCNSGTTILGRAIQRHKDVNGPEDEGPLTPGWPNEISHFLCPHTFRVWAHPIFSKGREYFPGDNLAYYLTELTEKTSSQVKSFYSQFIPNNERISDHSPQLVLRARALQGIFPDAYFVMIVRNGYAVSEGIKRKRFYDPDRPHMSGFETRIEDAAVQWNESNRILQSYVDNKLLSNVMTIKYENLVDNTNVVLMEVLNFCNLNPASYTFPEFDTNRNSEQIARLSKNEIDTITRVAHPMLTYFGYDSTS